MRQVDVPGDCPGRLVSDSKLLKMTESNRRQREAFRRFTSNLWKIGGCLEMSEGSKNRGSLCA